MKEFSYDKKLQDVEHMARNHAQKCMHCSPWPHAVRRPLGLTPISKVAREYLHADSLYLNQFSHLPVIVDNATGKVFLKHCKVEIAEVMALALMEFAGVHILHR